MTKKLTIRPNSPLMNPDLQRPSSLDSTPRDMAAIWLDKNENPDPALMDVALGVLQNLPALSISTYPESGALYRKLADWVGVEPESLLLTPGSDGAIRMVFEAFVDSGDAVVHTSPTFAMYSVYSQMFGVKAHTIEYTPSENGPVLDVDALFSALRQVAPKLLCLPNPDSPTGTVLGSDVLRQILTVCEEAGTVLLLDEAYHPFYAWTGVPWVASSRNLIVARSFAKAWGVAGLRIGYAVAHSETIALLHKMRPMYEVSTIAVDFMVRMMDEAPAMMASVERIRQGKGYFSREMEDLGFKVLPTSGNFLHVAFGECGPSIHDALLNKVLYRVGFSQPCLVGYSRFSVAPWHVMQKVVNIIKKAVEQG